MFERKKKMVMGRVARKGGAHVLGVRSGEKGCRYSQMRAAATKTLITARG
jgi:hypothetical protein